MIQRRKTGIWKPIRVKTYTSRYAQITGSAHLQEATFGSGNVIATGIYGNDSTVTIEVKGQGRDQWVSFYHQNIDDMGFGDQLFGQPDRINGTWHLRRISSVVVNGDTSLVHILYQKDTHKGVILSNPLLLPLQKGKNTITFGGPYNGFDYKPLISVGLSFTLPRKFGSNGPSLKHSISGSRTGTHDSSRAFRRYLTFSLSLL
ncbi:glycoside hydrolase family 43 [Colletotrichum tamarilloi]|uniref:Glycoside hydrolase family 43 n=1 Tax=Colletotrichum tamarilloi TaxID=1209934 RepID=A0ABQ9R7X1_9PEZI|nr:glycoside hydrolase family 43 [Colletotrichum tamarilloi]KAK1497136.1 glycoside hydrolase family 43 [Colletotrichum tamarilloi]